MEEDEEYEIKFREDEELEFFTELAVHETERWIQAVTKKTFQFPEDTRKSLENGVLLCELANSIHPGAIRRINRLPTPIAGLDNVNVFLKACKSIFNLNDNHLFNPSDLEDLSQRAIGESDRLKGEYEKRLRNVAVTIYWLGRYAASKFQGPQLDQSAFSALVHQKHEAEILERDFRHSSSSSSSTWDWKHSGHHNVRDGSVDSFGKESIDSLEDSVSPSRYSNTAAAARSSDRDILTSNSINRPDTMSTHRRYSSTDSLNGSTHSGHSRQGSDSAEPVFPTRRLSAQMTRRTSSSADPLQFIKGKTATELAEMAAVQMRISAESKKMASETKVQEEESIDWQANLSTWKNRRKSQSERSYQLKEDLERMEREKGAEAEQTSILTTKTFSQMQEERERRKSTSRHFYPINDDEDDEIFPSRKQTSVEKSREEVLQSMHKPKAEVAPWARESPENQNKDEEEEEEEDDSGSEHDDINNNGKENAISPSKNSSTLHSALSHNWRSLDSEAKTQDSDQMIQRTQAPQQNAPPSFSRHSSLDSKRTDNYKSSGTNVGPRTQSKIGSLLQNFQQSSNKPTLPKEGYKESIDLSARKNVFEQYGADDSFEDKSRDFKHNSDSRWNQTNSFSRNDQDQSQSPSVGMDDKLSSSFNEDGDGEKLIQIEKTIKISQKPNNDKGFGFFLTGGVDQGRPLCVSKVTLGSAADLCELKVKDEILRVNQTDAKGKTAGEVGDVIGRAVGTGFIELRVRRTCTEDEMDEEDDDMTPSSDEGEEDLSNYDSHTSKNGNKNGHLQKMPEPSPDNSTDRIEMNTKSVSHSAPSPANSEDIGKDEDDGPPAILRKWQRQRQQEEYTIEDAPSTDSPFYKKISLNAALPRRTSVERMEMSQDSSLNYSKPSKTWDDRMKDWTTKQDEERAPDSSQSTYQGANGQAQHQAHQETMQMAYEESLKSAEKNAEELLKKEQEFLQPEMDKTRILEERRMERRNRIQETAAAMSSQPQASASSRSSPSFTNLPLPSSFLPASTSTLSNTKRWQASNSSEALDQEPSTVPFSSSNTHATSMTFDVGPKTDARAPVSYTFPKQQGVIVIDPRISTEKQQSGDSVEFQAKLSSNQIVDQNSMSFLEAERERIRKEERRKVEEERMREQKQWEAKQEEIRKMEVKERELREKEEMLRQERERFLKEQEEFKRMREQQIKEQQQMQFHAEPKQQKQHVVQQQQQHQQQYQPQQQSDLQPSHSLHQNLYPNSQQFQNYHQHISKQQPQSMLDPNSSAHHSRTSSASPTYYQASSTGSSPQPSRSKTSWGGNQSERSNGYRSGSSSGFSQTQPPEQDKYQRGTSTMTGGRFSKEDMLAVNRKAAPEFDISRKSPENQYLQQQQQYHQQQQHQLQQRVPSPNAKDSSQPKGHTINSAPKARLRDDSEWQDPNRQAPRNAQRREDGIQPRKSQFGNSQEHWLVQEAERRRIAESDSRMRNQTPTNQGQVLYPGPIKPQSDNMSNRWKNNADTSPSMPRAIRQTLLQKTSSSRGPEGSSNSYPGEPFPSQHRQHYQQPQQQQMISQQQFPNYLSPHSNNLYHPKSQEQQHKGPSHFMPNDPINRYSPNFTHQPPPRAAPSSNYGDSGLPMNGSQLCSHCNQELGFGAAMVIESLGIFFHLQCFKCCVCHASLGTGSQGADVRVRMNKLHCPNCYSNDEAGLKYSKV